ncbi:S8 family serine peptidase [Shewanella sp.]|uniref:S8 family serine peptidase n=1 Tax=Shewanella sp. TaxID=50422 RepID=UPI0035677B6C
MFNKSILALAIATSASGLSHASVGGDKAYGWQSKISHVINAAVEAPVDAEGRSRYIVQLVDLPAVMQASLQLQKQGHGALKVRGKPASQQMSAALKTPAMNDYRVKLKQNQSAFVANVRQALSRDVAPAMTFDLAYNGMVVSLTAAEAKQLLALPQVMRVIKEVPTQLLTDNGPQHIGAPGIWDGSLSGTAAQGEGVVIGILDTGVNTDNRAFAATGDDGYTVVNPLGSGNYLGDCVVNANLCNDKLIGVYSYPFITDQYEGMRPATGEDYNGHGSHTASTAGGNVLLDVDVLRPEIGQPEGDGTPIGTRLAKISGVAPHANIISYQICNSAGCYPSLTVAAVEQAIKDGVDVLNYSVGPSGGVQSDPWGAAEQVAFLTAREAGVFVAQAAGNDGARASTTGNNAPWATIVGAATHERVWTHPVIGSSVGGDLAPIDGYASIYVDDGTRAPATNTVETPKEVVYAGDFTDKYGNNMALCDKQVYSWDPVAELLNDKIVICDRGLVPLDRKVRNLPYGWRVKVAGVVIRTTASSEQNMVEVTYGRPTALITRSDGDALMTWLREAQAAGDTPSLTIGAAVARYDMAAADMMAGFSSRGPYAQQPEVMVPNISAPGVNVFAAYADEQPFHGNNAAPADFQILSGTSMASPHVAGAAALLHQVHPDWTPAEIQSAMMLTANSQVTKNDDGSGAVAAGFFDTGSGVLRVGDAVRAGLIMDVPSADYRAASPYADGDFPSLNMPYLSNSRCPGTCSWTRTFKATQDGSWTAATEGFINGITTSISPSQFDVLAGETVTVKVTANVAQRVSEDWSFLRLSLTPSDGSPKLSLPVALKPMIAEVPKSVSQNYFWSKGVANIPGLRFRYPQDVVVSASPLLKATSYTLSVAPDSDNTSPFDDIHDGTATMFLNVEQESSDLRVIVGATSAEDVDVFIGLDSNGDGLAQTVEISQICATPASVGESCSFNAGAGRYWVMVHNYQGSGAEKDEVRLDVLQQPVAISADASASVASDNLDPYEPTSLELNWAGDLDSGVYYGAVEVFDRNSATTTRVLGSTQVQLNRTAPTAIVNVVQPEFARAQLAEVSFMLPGNPTMAELTYEVRLEMSDDLRLVSASGNESNAIAYSDKGFEVTLPAGAMAATVVAQIAQTTPGSGEFPVSWTLTTTREGFETKQGVITLTNSNHAPVLSVSSSVEADMNSVLELSLGGSDEDGDELHYSMVQTSGPAVAVTVSEQGEASLKLPAVDHNRVATFSVTVSDGEFSATKDVSVTIRNTDNGGGALGAGMILGLLTLVGLRRKYH